MWYHCSTQSGWDASSPPTFRIAERITWLWVSFAGWCSVCPRKRRMSSFFSSSTSFSTISIDRTLSGRRCSSKLSSPLASVADDAEKVSSSPLGVVECRMLENSPAASRIAPLPITTNLMGPSVWHSAKNSSKVCGFATSLLEPSSPILSLRVEMSTPRGCGSGFGCGCGCGCASCRFFGISPARQQAAQALEAGTRPASKWAAELRQCLPQPLQVCVEQHDERHLERQPADHVSFPEVGGEERGEHF
mmetsp:Transcript_4070/g.15715  ORF Transcript_4070/g.15715 Transcript_4070/m.15715 type:complete len:248 (-) Transcript_4070:2258-3001(-)